MGSTVFFAVGDDLHFMPGFGEELICLGSSFFGAGFGSAGAVRHEIAGDGLKHAGDEFGLFAGRVVGGVDGLGPVAQGVERAFEADAIQRNMVQMRGLLHESAHQVVGDQMDLEFLLDHAWALAAQHIEAEGGLDLGEVDLSRMEWIRVKKEGHATPKDF